MLFPLVSAYLTRRLASAIGLTVPSRSGLGLGLGLELGLDLGLGLVRGLRSGLVPLTFKLNLNSNRSSLNPEP
jgi:hypothetical protein